MFPHVGRKWLLNLCTKYTDEFSVFIAIQSVNVFCRRRLGQCYDSRHPVRDLLRDIHVSPRNSRHPVRDLLRDTHVSPRGSRHPVRDLVRDIHVSPRNSRHPVRDLVRDIHVSPRNSRHPVQDLLRDTHVSPRNSRHPCIAKPSHAHRELKKKIIHFSCYWSYN